MKVDDLVRIEIVPASDRHKKASQNVDKYELVDEQEPDEHGRPSFVVQNTEKGTFHTIKVVKKSNLVYYVDSTDDYFQKQGKDKNDYSAPILFVCQKAGAEMINVPVIESEETGETEGLTRHDEAMAGNTRAEEEATRVERKGEPTTQPVEYPGIVAPVIDEETAIEHFQRFQRLKERVLADSDYIFYDSNGKPTRDKKKATGEYIRKSGWRKISLMFNISCPVLNREKFYGEDKDGKYYGWIYYVRATAPNGRFQDAEGVCTSRDPFFCKRKNRETGEYEWVDTDEKNIMHTAQTRGFNRAISDLVGSGELSAEEV